MSDPITREELKQHMDHIKESLHGVRNDMAPLAVIQMDLAVVKTKMESVETENLKVVGVQAKHDKDIGKLKRDYKWIAGIFAFIQSTVIAYFNIKK